MANMLFGVNQVRGDGGQDLELARSGKGSGNPSPVANQVVDLSASGGAKGTKQVIMTPGLGGRDEEVDVTRLDSSSDSLRAPAGSGLDQDLSASLDGLAWTNSQAEGFGWKIGWARFRMRTLKKKGGGFVQKQEFGEEELDAGMEQVHKSKMKRAATDVPSGCLESDGVGAELPDPIMG